ncbi:hypothetical protein ACP275_14G154500 [Erythranthe tilingii]
MLEGNSEVPGWLTALLTEKFFNACIIHEDVKRNEKNVFCLDCCDGICPHCLLRHRSHRLLQIRRYVYHNVIKLVDAERLMDCAQVQTYTSNFAKVVFLNKRHHTRLGKAASGKYCINCDRNVQDSNLFCCISCKLQTIIRTGKKVSNYLHKCEFLALSEPGFDDGQMTPDSVLEPAGSMRTESGSSGGGAAGYSECRALATTATTEAVRKKRSSSKTGHRSACRPVSGIYNSETTLNRRKGTPQRSPLL